MTKRRVLVTGGAGFLGSHLCDALLALGTEVVAVDNFCTGNLANVAHLNHEPRFSLVEHDICVPFDVGAVDYVFNFASPASPPHYMRLGIETLMVGSAGTQNALDIAKKYGAGFLHASTSECYGDPKVHPQTESYWGNVNPVGLRSVYDEAKRYSEALVMAYHRYHRVNTHLVRIFNTYGPRLDPNDGRIISNVITQALRGAPLTVYGDGMQTRSFCYVSDLIDGVLRLSATDESMPVNIGNPHEFTIMEAVQLIRKITGSKSQIVFEPLPQDDPMQRKPDIEQARMLLAWEPQVQLEEGLRLTIPFYQTT